MGFGILFIGYFFVLNFAYCDYTDALAAMLILYALYKLSSINQSFKLASYVAMAFSVLGLSELSIAVYDMFSPIAAASPAFTVTALLRHLVLAFLSFAMLIGIRDVADEVGLAELSKKSCKRAYISVIIYGLNIFLESASIASFISPELLAALYLATILATLAITVSNLITIYSAYMRICMPGDEDMKERESKFAFVNAFRKHEEEKSREYAEYKLQKLKNSRKKKEGKKKQ